MNGLQYAVRLPCIPSLSGIRPPVLVMLHGRFEDERDLLPLATLIDNRFLVVSARAPFPQFLRVGCIGDRCRLEQGRGFAWFAPEGHLFLGHGAKVNDDEVRASANAILCLIDDVVARYGGDRTRVYLLGFSQGAIMSEGLLVTNPDRIAGAVAFSGRLLPIFEDCSARKISDRSAIIFHGTDDPIVPISEGMAAAQFLKAHGVDVAWRQFDGTHSVPWPMAEEASAWLTSRVDRSS